MRFISTTTTTSSSSSTTTTTSNTITTTIYTAINNRNNTFNKENKGAVRFTIHDLQMGRRKQQLNIEKDWQKERSKATNKWLFFLAYFAKLDNRMKHSTDRSFTLVENLA